MTAAGPWTDLHCHVLPGLDDGPPDLSTAVALCRAAAEAGTTRIAATCHQFGTYADVDAGAIRAACDILRQALAERGVDVELLPSAEWMIHADWVDAPPATDSALTVGDGGHFALVEFPGRTHSLATIAGRLADVGLRPILAHIDRYTELLADPVQVYYLIRDGYVVQMNADTITGTHGRRRRFWARSLVQSGLVHVVASDAHDPVRRGPSLAAAHACVREWCGRSAAQLLFRDNPDRILAGELPHSPGQVSWRRRLFNVFG